MNNLAPQNAKTSPAAPMNQVAVASDDEHLQATASRMPTELEEMDFMNRISQQNWTENTEVIAAAAVAPMCGHTSSQHCSFEGGEVSYQPP